MQLGESDEVRLDVSIEEELVESLRNSMSRSGWTVPEQQPASVRVSISAASVTSSRLRSDAVNSGLRPMQLVPECGPMQGTRIANSDIPRNDTIGPGDKLVGNG
uniref:Uncharacterized protein n=1 Tax=Lactuca sativa TaxID=4236 RepID=A0A9R1XN28_LACSA|nr:hypothetical protein LSAT_V11C400170790 [Lactuca sativa]